MRLKKLMLSLLGLCVLLWGLALPVSAEAPVIEAGEKSFDFSSGCYVLKKGVYVSTHGCEIRSQEAKVNPFTQEVWATGHVTLKYEDLAFECDHIYAEGSKHNVSIEGDALLKRPGLTITSQKANYQWDTGTADFYDNVKVQETSEAASGKKAKKSQSAYKGKTFSHVQYLVKDNRIALAE